MNRLRSGDASVPVTEPMFRKASMNKVQALQQVNHAAVARMLCLLEDELSPVNSVLLLSPNDDDVRFVKSLFPHALISSLYESDWNLYDPAPDYVTCFDTAFAHNVLMYSKAPEVWIQNILRVSRYFVAQDIKYRKRSSEAPYLGRDRDETRYSLTPETCVQPTFDLMELPNRPIQYFEYAGISNEYHLANDPPIHICMAFQSETYNQPSRRPGPRRRLSSIFHGVKRIFDSSLTKV